MDFLSRTELYISVLFYSKLCGNHDVGHIMGFCDLCVFLQASYMSQNTPCQLRAAWPAIIQCFLGGFFTDFCVKL